MEKSSRVQVNSKKAGSMCISCGRNDKRIQGHGLCSVCYLKKWTAEHKDRRKTFSSHKHTACVNCGTTEKFHQGQGMCASCYSKYWAVNNRERTRELANITYYRHYERETQRRKDYRLQNQIKVKQGKFKGKYNGNGIKALERDNYACADCGFTEFASVLEIHHKNKDRRDNGLENLISLCPTCHKIRHYIEHDIVRTYRQL